MKRIAVAQRCLCGVLLGVTGSLAAQPIAFKDMTGATVQLKQAAQRSVTLPMPGASVFATVNGGTKGLAGMHPNAHNNLDTTLLPQMLPGFKQVNSDITRGGFVPNVEALMKLQPDMVWQWGYLGQEIIEPLQKAGLNTAALMLGHETDTRQWIRLFAISLGKPERGEQIVAWRAAMERKVREQVAKVPANKRLKVMHLSRYKTGLAASGQSGNFQFDLSVAGGINANTLKVAAPNLNVEQVMQWDPEVIVLSNFERDLTPETIYQDPMLADISAVRNKRVYKIPAGGYYWEPPNQDTPLYWAWLAKLMYPEQVQLDLRQEMREAYRMLYAHTLTEAQIDQALQWPLNKASAHYAKAFATSPTAAVALRQP